MLIIADAIDRMKVYRVDAGPNASFRREYLFAIKKRELEVPPESLAKLTPEEVTELEETIDVLKHAETLRQQATALNLPSTLRTAVDYVLSSASPSEARLILQAIEEARRDLRKLEVRRESAMA